ncbi:hypothetical protein [Streptococcus sp. NLN76]|uniref:hypothetical protein n=2 Tax=unclassified Streptococcus TaxID=2608887 RepID=UPI0018ABC502|nr:hypothetical protein [Streptococcus sp. NLN76]MBF8971067.1 hypothetical protein [Streptococcus sp. NLN76]
MTLYDSISQKLGKDLLQYIEEVRLRDAQKTDWTEDDTDDIKTSPLYRLTLEELDEFEKYAWPTYTEH